MNIYLRITLIIDENRIFIGMMIITSTLSKTLLI